VGTGVRPAQRGDGRARTRVADGPDPGRQGAATLLQVEQVWPVLSAGDKRPAVDDLRPEVEAVLRDPGKGFYSVAEVDGRVVGQMMVTFEWSDWRNGTFWWLQSVYVQPAFRGQGVYRRIYQQVLDEAKARGEVCGVRLYVSKENRIAQQVYERLGLKPAHYAMYEVDFVLER